MKAIGMYLIVWGHFFSIGNIYVYTFSVPLFFLISGFLSRLETDSKVFWKKIWFNLIVPLILIAVTNFLILGAFHLTGKGYGNFFKFAVLAILGFHSSIGALWFVYTLVLLKILLQYLPKYGWYLIIIFLLASVVLNYCPIELYGHKVQDVANAIVDTCLAYPFFFFGYYLKKFREQLCTCKITWKWLIPVFAAILSIYVCGSVNGNVYLYINRYGNYLPLCLLGGLTGSFLTYFISKALDKCRNQVTYIISKGSIIILGFHGWLITCFRKIFVDVSWLDFILALCILLMFVPFILLVERYFPLLMGKYRRRGNIANKS